MKKALFLLLFVAVCCVSCDFKRDKSTDGTSGKINSLSVIIDDQMWNGEVGDSLRNKFASPVLGLPQEEPLFVINQYPVKLLEGYMANSRNILIIKKEARNHFEIKENEYRALQNVIHISGKTTADIIQQIEANAPQIIEKIHQTEIAENQRQIRQSLLDDSKITKKFGISLAVPSTYRYVMQRQNFIWLKNEITSGNTSILIYQVPIRRIKKNNDITNNIIRMRDSLGSRFIHGTVPGTIMVTEDSYAPYLSTIKIGSRETFETKGTWELRNDFMSGPFINYAIVDKPNKRILVIEGFCYAPSKQKRDLMLELEAIIKSVKFLKNKKTGRQ